LIAPPQTSHFRRVIAFLAFCHVRSRPADPGRAPGVLDDPSTPVLPKKLELVARRDQRHERLAELKQANGESQVERVAH